MMEKGGDGERGEVMERGRRWRKRGGMERGR